MRSAARRAASVPDDPHEVGEATAEKHKSRQGFRADLLAGRILRECAAELAAPICRLAGRLLADGVWPDVWRSHWIFPLFKRGSPAQPGNYRGIHLTSMLSKVVERSVGLTSLPFLHVTNAFGINQWAFRPAHSCRDLTTLRVATWLLDAHNKKNTAMFLSDISGAFDRVDVNILLAKCRRAGLGPPWARA